MMVNEEVRFRHIEDAEVTRPRDRGLAGTALHTTPLQEEVLEDMKAIVGTDGELRLGTSARG